MADEPDDRASVKAEMIRAILARLPRLTGFPAPAGSTCIAQRDVAASGLDESAVNGWLRERGGFADTAYIRSSADRPTLGSCRPPVHGVRYISVPLGALDTPIS